MPATAFCDPTNHRFGFADIQPILKRDPIAGEDRMIGATLTIFCKRCGVFRTEKIEYADK